MHRAESPQTHVHAHVPTLWTFDVVCGRSRRARSLGREWTKKGLDTGPGNELFRESLDKAVSNQSAQIGNLKLFKRT